MLDNTDAVRISKYKIFLNDNFDGGYLSRRDYKIFSKKDIEPFIKNGYKKREFANCFDMLYVREDGYINKKWYDLWYSKV